MFTFHFKKTPKLLANTLSWLIISAFLIAAIYIFLFIYQNIYFAIVQELAIINLKSELTITKVHKQRFDSLYESYLTKDSPLIIINFQKLNNPFKSIVIVEEVIN